jgi:hypothetical protein
VPARAVGDFDSEYDGRCTGAADLNRNLLRLCVIVFPNRRRHFSTAESMVIYGKTRGIFGRLMAVDAHGWHGNPTDTTDRKIMDRKDEPYDKMMATVEA